MGDRLRVPIAAIVFLIVVALAVAVVMITRERQQGLSGASTQTPPPMEDRERVLESLRDGTEATTSHRYEEVKAIEEQKYKVLDEVSQSSGSQQSPEQTRPQKPAASSPQQITPESSAQDQAKLDVLKSLHAQ